jgi:hypothetical protein
MVTADARRTTRRAAVLTQKACAWCGPALVVGCVIGLLLLAHFAPPPAPSLSAARIAAIFEQRTIPIRFGVMLVVFAAALLGPFIAVISVHMRRIEGPRPTLSYLQLVFGACFIMEIIFPMMAIQTAAFRPERDQAIQQTLHDFGWLTFFGVASTAFVQLVIIGVVILQDSGPTPVFPRWAGYFNIWVGFAFSPGTVMIFFKSGPLAWNGIFIFWIPFTAFFLWLIIMPWLLLKAIDRETAEESVGELAGPAPVSNQDLDGLHQQIGVLSARLDELRDRLPT